MNDRITTEDTIEKAEQYEDSKQILLRLLDDLQLQQKMRSILRKSTRSTSKR